MKKLAEKIKRVDPIIRIKKSELDTEAFKLSEIKQEKISAVAQLKEIQRRYIVGVDRINHCRVQGELAEVSALEPALEASKIHWHRSLKYVSQLDEAERRQVDLVLDLKKGLMSFEALRDKYVEQLNESEKKSEQKALDETAIQNHGE